MFDYVQLKHFGINPEILPPGSLIINKPVSFLEKNRAIVLQAVTVMAVMVVMIFYLVMAILRGRRTAQALRKSEARYRLLSENTADVIWTMDITTKRCTYMSPSVARLRGLTPEEAMALTLEETLAPESYRHVIESLPARIAAFSSGDQSARIQSYLTDQLCKDGSTVPTEDVTTLLTNEYGVVTEVLGVTRDITERKKAEEALVERETQLSTIFRVVPVGIGYSVDRVFREVNDTMSNITGYSRDELLGRNARMLYETSEEYENVGRERSRQISENGMSIIETRWKRKDGALRDVVITATPWDANNHSKGLIFTALDISKHKEAEQALRESEYLLSKSQEIAHLGSYYFDVQTGTWIGSKTLYAVWGIDESYPKTVEGWIQIVHPDHREEMLHHLEKHVLTKRNSFDKEYRIVRQNDRQERWVHGTGELEFDAGGQTIRMIGTIQDITEKKLAQEENEKLEAPADPGAKNGIHRTPGRRCRS